MALSSYLWLSCSISESSLTFSASCTFFLSPSISFFSSSTSAWASKHKLGHLVGKAARSLISQWQVHPPLIWVTGELFIIDFRYWRSNLMSCFCRATFSSKTILSCSFSLPCVRVNTGNKVYSYGSLKLGTVFERWINSPPLSELPPAERRGCALQFYALPLVLPLESEVHPLPAVRSWPQFPDWKYRFPSWRGSGLPELRPKIEMIGRHSLSQACVIRYRIPRNQKSKLTQEVVVLMQWPLPCPVFVHEVEEHLQGFPITTLGREFRDSMNRCAKENPADEWGMIHNAICKSVRGPK